MLILQETFKVLAHGALYNRSLDWSLCRGAFRCVMDLWRGVPPGAKELRFSLYTKRVSGARPVQIELFGGDVCPLYAAIVLNEDVRIDHESWDKRLAPHVWRRAYLKVQW